MEESTRQDRWPSSGSRPGSDAVQSDENLLRRALPAAVQDNMFRPAREHTERAASAVPHVLRGTRCSVLFFLNVLRHLGKLEPCFKAGKRFIVT